MKSEEEKQTRSIERSRVIQVPEAKSQLSSKNRHQKQKNDSSKRLTARRKSMVVKVGVSYIAEEEKLQVMPYAKN